MTEWGRNAAIAAGTPPRKGWSRAGKSIFCAMLALGGVLIPGAILTALPSDAPEFIATIATTAVVIAFLLVAPLLHIAGSVFGFMALFGVGDRRVLGAFGTVLNLGLLAIGVFFVMMASSTIGAVT